MTNEAQWRSEWEVLRADRERARRAWRSAADGLAARSRDPLGLGRIVGEHPIAAGGIGAAAAAFLVKFLVGRSRAPRQHADGVETTPRPASVWPTVLRDIALSVGMPWLLRTLKEKFGWDLQPGAAAEPERSRPEAADSSPNSAQR